MSFVGKNQLGKVPDKSELKNADAENLSADNYVTKSKFEEEIFKVFMIAPPVSVVSNLFYSLCRLRKYSSIWFKGWSILRATAMMELIRTYSGMETRNEQLQEVLRFEIYLWLKYYLYILKLYCLNCMFSFINAAPHILITISNMQLHFLQK